MRSEKVVFMGSPGIAVETLQAVAGEFTVVLAVTQPERPSGRGRKPNTTEVHKKAEELGIPVLATADVNSPECIAKLEGIGPAVIVVVSFGQILKKKVLGIAPYGCMNVHFSLLPELRGAAPVAWAIMRGMRQTGVSIIEMIGRMDAGPICAQADEPIRDDDTAGGLSERLGELGARLLVEVLRARLKGAAKGAEQDESKATYAPKITRALGALDWTRKAEDVDRLIRGLSGQSEAYAFLGGAKRVRVSFYSSAPRRTATDGAGVATRGAGGELIIGCGEGAIEVREIQAEGRKRVSGRDFANGYHIGGGEIFLNG